MKNMQYSGIVILSVAIILVVISYESSGYINDGSHSLEEINDMMKFVHDCIPGNTEYRSIFQDVKIHKQPMELKWSEESSHDEDSYKRFDVEMFNEVLYGVKFPLILDTIFDKMSYYSKYEIGYSTFWVYSSMFNDISPIMADIFKAYKMMIGLSSPAMKNRNYVFHIFLVDNPKTYSTTSGGLVGIPSNVNSGRAIGNKVFIWRKEEICKVFIHEMVHLLQLDMSGGRNAVNKKLLGVLNIRFTSSSVYSLHESFTETVTKILYSKFLAHMRDTDFETEFYSQVSWTMDQCAKVLHLNGIRDFTGVFELEQKTFMYEYYILHALFLYDVYETEDYGKYLNFVHINTRKRSFASMTALLQSVNTSSFITEIQSRLDLIPDNFGKSIVTLKMSRT